jgi:RNA polymerase primary sigma factor
MKLNVKGGTGVIVSVNNRKHYDMYLNEISNFKPLSKDEEYELFRRLVEEEDDSALDKIYKHNLLFVVSVARKYASITNSNVISLEDLINDGNIGLMMAARKFDYKSGFRFLSYAVWWIRQQILTSIQSNVKNIRIPPAVRTEINLLKKIQTKLEQELGRDISVVEIFDYMVENDLIKKTNSIERIDELLKMEKIEVSLNTTVGTEDGVELGELIAGDSFGVDDFMNKFDSEVKVRTFLSNIPKKYAELIIDFYGLFGNKKLKIEELSEKHNVSPTNAKFNMNKHINYYGRRQRFKSIVSKYAENETKRTTYKKDGYSLNSGSNQVIW